MMRLAGTYHPIPYLLDRVIHYLPGVHEISGLWLDYDKQLYSSNESHPIRDELKVKLQKLRQLQISADWSQNSNLFDENINAKKQLSLGDENAMNVLRLYFTSPVDGLRDIIAITFPNNVFLKNLDIEFKGISTQEKRILSNLLLSVLTTEHERVIEERGFLQNVEKINLKTENKITQLKGHLASTEQLYSSAIRNILNDFKIKYEKELKKEFIFSNKIASLLAKEHLSIERIEDIVRNAIYLAYNLNISVKTIQIKEDHIQIGQDQKMSTSRIERFKNEDKISILLDRYEEAALKSQEKGLMVNGKNIASQLDPPVTPPAITDAVKKNSNKISYLLQQYPENWRLVRKYIKPIQNIDQGESFRQVV